MTVTYTPEEDDGVSATPVSETPSVVAVLSNVSHIPDAGAALTGLSGSHGDVDECVRNLVRSVHAALLVEASPDHWLVEPYTSDEWRQVEDLVVERERQARVLRGWLRE